ncbi:MAG: sensor histidine kinase [Clostridium sp.]|nr:sensor histidine kinase [Clostridium sp.]
MNLTKELSIKKLSLLIFIIMYIIFFFLTSYNLYSYSEYESNKTDKIMKNLNSNISKQVTEKINAIFNVSKFPLLIPDITKLHKTLDTNSITTIEDINYLKNICEMMLIEDNTINGAYIYNANGSGTFATRNQNAAKLKNTLNESWFKNALNTDGQITLVPNITEKNIFDDELNINENNFGFTRKIIDVKNKKTTGIILLTLPISSVQEFLSKELAFNNEILSIYDAEGNLLLSTNEKDQGIEPTNNDLTRFLYEPDIEIKRGYVKVSNTIPSTKWLLVSTIPKSNAYHIDNLYIFLFIINILFFSILFIILFLFFNKRVFKPLDSLIDNMNIKDNLDISFEYPYNDEVGTLIKSYNKMKIRIKDLININYKSKIEQKELELKQLQNQINPHFIYNTLESIHMMAEINDDLETSVMAEYFGSIIRYSMNRKINTVSLRDEMKIIDNYIYLQKIRFDQIFTITNLIDDTLLNCEIIKMIIQPIIENAINHGLSECTDNGQIIIQGQRINDNLMLTITDNGIGMDEDTLKDLNDYINDKNNKFKGIALRNIHRRLKLNYGEEYGIEIFSIPNNGTSITLTLPFIMHKINKQ